MADPTSRLWPLAQAVCVSCSSSLRVMLPTWPSWKLQPWLTPPRAPHDLCWAKAPMAARHLLTSCGSRASSCAPGAPARQSGMGGPPQHPPAFPGPSPAASASSWRVRSEGGTAMSPFCHIPDFPARSTWGQSRCWAMRPSQGDEGARSPETKGCWEKTQSPPENQSDPLRAELPWVLPAAPSPIPSGPLGPLGSAQWGLHPRVIIPVQNWGAVAVPQSEWHLPTYLFPSGVTAQGWVGVPEWFLCSPPFRFGVE